MKDGESIAVTSMSKALVEEGCVVTLLAMNTTKHYTDVSTLPSDFDHYDAIYEVEVNNRLNPVTAFFNLFSSESYHVSRFISVDFKNKLIEILSCQEFDVVQLETLYLTPYIDVIRKYSKAIITMRSHNIEFEIWERIANNTISKPKKWYINHLSTKLKNYELENLNQYDYLIAVSDRDLKKFKKLGYKNGAMASPIGLELKNYKICQKKPANHICFIGSLDWRPNIEGVEWFIANVWPKLSLECPTLEFHIAGRNSPKTLKTNVNTRIYVHGEVPSAIDFINNYGTMIVPLFSGSGTRVKILEAMALGKTIVTTTIGTEGIEAITDHHLLIADTPDEFITQIRKAIDSENLRAKLGLNSLEFVKQYDHNENAKILIAKYNQLINEPYNSVAG
jgi:polysaccharide biosynthesis protein PslH